MRKIIGTVLLSLSILLLIFACSTSSRENGPKNDRSEKIAQQVFLIGNGPNSKETIKDIIEKSGIRKGGYVVILPMTQNKQDSSAHFLQKEFYEQQIMAVHILGFYPDGIIENSDILSIENASIIYLLGGNRNKFMKLANKTPLKKSFLRAYKNGALMAGKGNGASVLGEYYYSQQMDTVSRNIKIELKPGLGLLKNTVVDDITFFTNYKEGIQKNSTKRGFVFLGLGYKSAVWIKNGEAFVLRESEIGFISPGNVKRKLNKGDKFSVTMR
ncbi:MAG: hypothetical protein DRJ05_02135 [Bacteroidetes bacterium]|nr:MAG: hypothetical protein DRJ05_02135 [Bacteroidota bacterium]